MTISPASLSIGVVTPASMSAWVATWFAVHVAVAPGASAETGHEIPVAFGSATAIEDTVTLPVLVMVKL